MVRLPFADAFAVMKHLSGMGESHAPAARPARRPSATDFIAAASVYSQVYGSADGSVPATFQVLYGIGWAPAESQPQPLARGSAQRSLKEVGTLSSDAILGPPAAKP